MRFITAGRIGVLDVMRLFGGYKVRLVEWPGAEAREFLERWEPASAAFAPAG